MEENVDRLGPLVRRWGLPVDQLPSETASLDELQALAEAILGEALPFIDTALPLETRKYWKSKGEKSSRASAAPVEVLERVVSAKVLRTIASEHALQYKAEEEKWVARLSVHKDAPKKGTATWEEFDRSFRLEHAKTEMGFTPAVIGAYEAQQWDCSDIEVDSARKIWGDFSLVVVEMRHKIGRPLLKDRTFPVLQLSCAVKEDFSLPVKDDISPSEFVIVSIPVPDFATSDKANLSKEKGAQIATYVSIERIRKLVDGKIEWLMSTASDAGGILPLWMQNKALGGIVWKDVPLFMRWIANEREFRAPGQPGRPVDIAV
ncbi:hypothetical protein GGS20DRAFT_89277 [Poronia punctata]|nr:hypothetical protein GGS20DRAFT_89277 [Poronia punctata]